MGTRKVGILLGVPIDRRSLTEVTEDALIAIKRKMAPRAFACANPHSLVVAHTDPLFRSALNCAATVVADGVGVTLTARIIGLGVGPRITGSDYFLSLMRALQQCGTGRVFFLGSSQPVLDLIAARFRIDFPALTLCGTCSPPYGSWAEAENSAMVETINLARPDVLWVGMTAPKQEKWVEENRHNLNVPVIGCIGAVFDFYARTYARAPQWVCRIGLEWAYRFMLEPRRMWQRNFVSTPKFLWLVLSRHVFGAGNGV